MKKSNPTFGKENITFLKKAMKQVLISVMNHSA
jgi:hypothetical protein